MNTHENLQNDPSAFVLTGADLLTRQGRMQDHALWVAEGRIRAILPTNAIPSGLIPLQLDGGILAPGLIDAQVNGGGGILFNDEPNVEAIAHIAQTHNRFGTTSLLPTLISDDLSVVARAIAAVDAAMEAQVPGVIGIHLEGPFLNSAKKGIHDASKFRRLDDAAIELLTQLQRGKTMITLAPELAPQGAIAALRARGAIVLAGHSLADYDQTKEALRAGLQGATHLFNAMPPLMSRAPGMIAAMLENKTTRSGIIVDGMHVHPALLRLALAARGLDGFFLVTDAMPCVGSDLTAFQLFGQPIRVVEDQCRGPDGTLAGSTLTIAKAVRNAVDMLELSLAQALTMASATIADLLGLLAQKGQLIAGADADLVHFSDDGALLGVWNRGVHRP